MELVSYRDRQQIEEHLAVVAERTLRPMESDAGVEAPREIAPLVQTLSQFVTDGGGKRLRPQLCVWSYRQSHGDDDVAKLPTAVLDIACAWELFHAFLLCHDDIIDKADRRRGRPTLHHRLASLDSGSVAFGTDLGIVAGDLLCIGAFRLLHAIDFEGSVLPVGLQGYRKLLDLFTRVAGLTGLGQAVDIVQSHVPIDQVGEETVLLGYHWKTAAYTFEGPMLSGAVLAGLADDCLPPVAEFARAVGQAYQLHNDLLDLRSVAHEGCDLMQGKRTPALLQARHNMQPACRQRFDKDMHELGAAGSCHVELAESLRQRLIGEGAVGVTQALLDRLLRQAEHAARHPSLPATLSAALCGMLAGMTAKYFAPALSEDPCG